MENSTLLKATVWIIIGIVVTVVLYIFFKTQDIYLFLCVLIPIITFLIIYLFMDLQKKKIQRILNESFGANVVKIANAIMTFFEFPLTMLLTLTLTLFFFAIAVIMATFWIDYWRDNPQFF